MSWHRVFQQDIMGLRFALNVFIATIITWICAEAHRG